MTHRRSEPSTGQDRLCRSAGTHQATGRRISISVVLAGGGTAGHTSPLIATAHELAEQHPGIRITALGTERGLETPWSRRRVCRWN